MQHNDKPLKKHLAIGWQVLGELELTVNLHNDHELDKWLAKIISPLSLHTDLLNKVTKSAQDAATRARQAETALKFGHIHLFVFAPQHSDFEGKTWGFFRIERLQAAAEGSYLPDHTIELYLYIES